MSEVRELIEGLCSAAVSYGERDTKDSEQARRVRSHDVYTNGSG